MKRPRLIFPTARENRAINRGIRADPDTYELSAAEIRSMRPLKSPRSIAPKAPVMVRLVRNTPSENRAINRGIRADPDTYELSAAEIRSMRPLKGPQSTTPKVPVTVRLDKAVVDYFKASGSGWQTRLNDALAAYVGRRLR